MDNIENHLAKREAFAVSLRKEKKLKILAKSRQSIISKLNLLSELTIITAQ